MAAFDIEPAARAGPRYGVRFLNAPRRMKFLLANMAAATTLSPRTKRERRKKEGDGAAEERRAGKIEKERNAIGREGIGWRGGRKGKESRRIVFVIKLTRMGLINLCESIKRVL